MKHNKMNTKNKPCEPARNYSYFSCIMKKVVTRTGCKPFWMTMIKFDLPPCSNYSMLNKYYKLSDEMLMMDEKTLYQIYQCLKPCSFMEYKVNLTIHIHQHKLFVQIITDRSETFPDTHPNEHHSPLLHVLQSQNYHRKRTRRLPDHLLHC